MLKISLAHKIILAGAFVGMLSVLAPWHTIGTALLGTEHSFSGLNDQNLIIGLCVFSFLLLSLLIVFLPLIGIRLPRLPFRQSTILIFLGGEAAFLVFLLTVMHATALTRAVNYDLRWGIYLALLASLSVFFGGVLQAQADLPQEVLQRPLAHLPGTSNRLDLKQESSKPKKPAHLRLDL